MISASIATINGRQLSLEQTVKSLQNQVHVIFIYINNYRKEPFKHDQVVWLHARNEAGDLGDAAKFYAMSKYNSDIWLTCDDDLTYDNGYVAAMRQGLLKYGGFVTMHGRRVVKQPIVSYYRCKDCYQQYYCLSDCPSDEKIHIPGSGVMAFKQNGFNHTFCKHKNMGDIWAGLYAKQNNLPVTVLSHRKGIVTHNAIDHKKTIHTTNYRNDTLQTKVVNSINWLM